MNEQRPTGTQAIDRAAALLVKILDSSTSLTFTQLMNETGLAKGTASRILGALERNELIQRTADGAFEAGAVVNRFALKGGGNMAISTALQPAMEAISEKTGEAVSLAVAGFDAVENIAQVQSTFLIGSRDWVGENVPFHCSASGKVFLAYGAQVLPDKKLEKITLKTITSRADLARELETVRARGYGSSNSELEEGLVAVSVPVFDANQNVIATVSVSGPNSRITPERIKLFANLLKQEVSKVKVNLGARNKKEGAA
ncbi:MAG: IclR family transcriptional regulator [Candidatus Nanopelagicales bacterium]